MNHGTKCSPFGLSRFESLKQFCAFARECSDLWALYFCMPVRPESSPATLWVRAEQPVVASDHRNLTAACTAFVAKIVRRIESRGMGSSAGLWQERFLGWGKAQSLLGATRVGADHITLLRCLLAPFDRRRINLANRSRRSQQLRQLIWHVCHQKNATKRNAPPTTSVKAWRNLKEARCGALRPAARANVLQYVERYAPTIAAEIDVTLHECNARRGWQPAINFTRMTRLPKHLGQDRPVGIQNSSFPMCCDHGAHGIIGRNAPESSDLLAERKVDSVMDQM